MKIGSPLYLVESREPCWKCHKPQRVIALATARVDDDDDMNTMDGGPENEPLLFKNVESLDPVLDNGLPSTSRITAVTFPEWRGWSISPTCVPAAEPTSGIIFFMKLAEPFFRWGRKRLN